jgi:hypothetical protein
MSATATVIPTAVGITVKPVPAAAPAEYVNPRELCDLQTKTAAKDLLTEMENRGF